MIFLIAEVLPNPVDGFAGVCDCTHRMWTEHIRTYTHALSRCTHVNRTHVRTHMHCQDVPT